MTMSNGYLINIYVKAITYTIKSRLTIPNYILLKFLINIPK